ncbi:hypothetical protein G4228_009067 [Cervus hanglu yarkandensis]|nr:hypothetical protein G4228_009067 [Cervus hanglu yarkandensis]
MMYEKEAKQQEEKIEKMKAEDGENYAIKKQVVSLQAEILQESRMMIPDCRRRLEAAHADLLQLLDVLFTCSVYQLIFKQLMEFKWCLSYASSRSTVSAYSLCSLKLS